MPTTQASELGRATGLRRAFELVQEIQTGSRAARSALSALGVDAAVSGWDEVALAALFGEAIATWWHQEPGVAARVGALVEAAEAAGDPAMLALGLAIRSDPGFSGDDPLATATREADLARAVVLLEGGEGGVFERITAHTACGIAFANRWLFELGHEQYAAALAIGEEHPDDDLDFILAPVVFDLAEAQVSWASTLRQLGDGDGVADRLRTWRSAAELAATAFELPEAWEVELGALGLVLAAIAGEDTAAQARRRMSDALSGPAPVRCAGLLLLAASLSDARRSRPDAAASTALALEHLDAHLHPHLYDLALYLAAELEAGPGGSAGLRYARRQLEQHWASRLATLGAMRSRIQAVRLDAEREQLSRHALVDPLTGVGNRRALEQYLDQLERAGVATVALVLLDLDHFKAVNDRFGHPAGDAVLGGIGEVLQASVRPGDLAVRLGGDEFAVVLAGADLLVAHQRAAELVARLDARSFEAVSHGLTVTVSAGVAAGPPEAISRLQREADAALYRAKGGGGERVARSRIAHAAP